MNLKDEPQTLVDRLNGIYPRAVDAYPVPPIQKEAAREILRLREEIEEIELDALATRVRFE